jgi:hypothetical protein
MKGGDGNEDYGQHGENNGNGTGFRGGGETGKGQGVRAEQR